MQSGPSSPRLPKPAIGGRIEQYALAELLYLLRLSGRTGKLVLTRGPTRVAMQLVQGQVLSISYPAALDELAHILVNDRVISESALQQLCNNNGVECRSLSPHALQQVGGISKQRLDNKVLQLISRAIARLTCWTVGCFSFQPWPVDALMETAEQSSLEVPAVCQIKVPDPPTAHELDRLVAAGPMSRWVTDAMLQQMALSLVALIRRGLLIVRQDGRLRALACIDRHRVMPAPAPQLAAAQAAWHGWLAPMLDGTCTNPVGPHKSADGSIQAAVRLMVLGRVQAVLCVPVSGDGAVTTTRLAELDDLLHAAGFSHELRLIRARWPGRTVPKEPVSPRVATPH